MIRWLLASAALVSATPVLAQTCPWRAAWGSSQLKPDVANALPAGAMADTTLRQIVRPSIAGKRVRVRVSNAFGDTPLHITAAALARSASNATAKVVDGSIRPLRFAGQQSAVIPPGADWLSDPVDLPIEAFGDLAVSLHLAQVPQAQTAHPGSRATSWFVRGEATAAADLPAATPIERWYLLSGIEVESCSPRDGVVVLGDSITDGRGSTTNGNDRWTDVLARRLGGRAAVINQGIGGNRVLLDGLGPSAMARLDRDVLALPGVGHLIVLEGVNDLGTLGRDRQPSAAEYRDLVARLTGAYAQIVARARARGLKVHGATILPFASNEYYHPGADAEAARQAINAWIRTPGHFDSVIDLDRVTRDPNRPDRLLPAYDTGDGLHPNPAGFRAMAEAVPLEALR
jgi:lysophospholipase L1-like esterase